MPNILIINSAPFTNEFIKPIELHFKSKNITYQQTSFNDIPKNKEQFDGVIISASPMGDDIIEEQLPYYQWLKTYKKPVVGSCHGHQLMGVLFGSEVIINQGAEEGMHTIFKIKSDKLFDNIKWPYTVEQHHIKSISLPKGFKLLASSKQCKVQVIKHATLPIYGLQFHIENAVELLDSFIDICG